MKEKIGETRLLSDEQIIRRVRKGDAAAFRELVCRYQGSVIRLCHGILGNRDDAEDAAQETFVRVFQNLSKVEKADSFWPWVRRIAINIGLRRLSARKPSEDIDNHTDTLTLSEDPVPDEVFQLMRSEEVRRFVYDLPAIYRTVITLRYSEDLSAKEIAEATGETLTTVHMRLHRAKKLLRERMVAICL